MSEAGKKKKIERLVKKANRHLLVDPEKMTPHDRKLWEQGTTRLFAELKKRKSPWVPKVGDRVWVSGKTWVSAGTITCFAKDDPTVPWIKVDKDGTSWDARDLGSIRKLADEE